MKKLTLAFFITMGLSLFIMFVFHKAVNEIENENLQQREAAALVTVPMNLQSLKLFFDPVGPAQVVQDIEYMRTPLFNPDSVSGDRECAFGNYVSVGQDFR